MGGWVDRGRAGGSSEVLGSMGRWVGGLAWRGREKTQITHQPTQTQPTTAHSNPLSSLYSCLVGGWVGGWVGGRRTYQQRGKGQGIAFIRQRVHLKGGGWGREKAQTTHPLTHPHTHPWHTAVRSNRLLSFYPLERRVGGWVGGWLTSRAARERASHSSASAFIWKRRGLAWRGREALKLSVRRVCRRS